MTLRIRVEGAVARRFLALSPAVLRRIVGPAVRSPDGLVLDLQAQALLWLMRMTGEPALGEGDLISARQRLERTGSLLAPRTAEVVRVRDRMVAGGVSPRRARIYTPPSAPLRGAPALVWFHGGGFVLGSIESHHDLCVALASLAGVVVVSVDYRLGPEHRFPAGLEDALASTRWVLDGADELGIDSGAVAVGGDSAGGNLAAVVAQELRGAARAPAFQLLVYPATDATCSEPSHRYFADGFMLTGRSIGWFLANYIADPGLATDPRVSPLLATDLAGLPPALVITAGFDPLRDEGRHYATRMREAGVAVDDVLSSGSLHGFLSAAGAMRESARVLTLATSALRRVLSACASSRL